NNTCSSLTRNVSSPFLTSIKASPVARNGISRINGTSLSSSISNTTKSTGNINLSILTSTSSTIPLGYVIERSANCKFTVDGFTSPSPNFLKIDKGIRLILAPRSHKALLKKMFPIVQGTDIYMQQPEGFIAKGHEWIQGLEFVFEVMECPERYRVLCAQLQLTGDARLWWNAYWSMRPGEKASCTWEMFKELIREKYYPTYYRAEMECQFLSLQQSTCTVDEYEREFTRLAAF
ncbi:Unknown protein, partial [Striga hermonthica]